MGLDSGITFQAEISNASATSFAIDSEAIRLLAAKKVWMASSLTLRAKTWKD
jgi:hypothetical protein